jgi:ribosomal protein S18 acetylase RimI-like enzyme
LVSRAIEIVAESGCREILADVRESNERSLRFFERLGFVRVASPKCASRMWGEGRSIRLRRIARRKKGE